MAINLSLLLLLPMAMMISISLAESFHMSSWGHRYPMRGGGAGGRGLFGGNRRGTKQNKPAIDPTSSTTSSELSSARTSTTDDKSVVDTVLAPLAYNGSAVDAASIPTDELWKVLDSNPVTGLTLAQVEARLEQYGPNQLKQPPTKSIWALIAEQFQDRLVQILLAVALLSGIFSWFEVKQQMQETQATNLVSSMINDHFPTLDPSAMLQAAEQVLQQEAAALWKSFVEPAVILAILVLNATVGVIQSRSAATSLAALLKLQPRLATVIRNNGVATELPAAEVVPGDVLQIRVGDKIPADSRLISIQSAVLEVDEGSLTGESITVHKIPNHVSAPNTPLHDQMGMLFAGTVVTRGSGKAVVLQTAADTQFGRIQQGVAEAAKTIVKTPLAQKLDEFGDTLTIVIAVICAAVWIVSIPKMNDSTFGGNFWQGAIYYAKVSVALGVAAIPEGLPAVITLCLSLGTRRMAERNVVVRQLQSVETLGCTSVICTDKTGTLTTNEMTAVSLVLFEKSKPSKNKNQSQQQLDDVREYPVLGISYSPIGSVEGIPCNTEVKTKPNGAVAEIAAVCALCNDAKIIGVDPDTTNGHDKKEEKKHKSIDGVYERLGEPTEAALCVLAEKLGGKSSYAENAVMELNDDGIPIDIPPSARANANVDAWRMEYPRVATLEFNRDRKSMSVLCGPRMESGTNQNKKSKNRLYVKGAPNLLLERCTKVKYRDGSVVKMSGELRREIEAKISEMAVRPLRCLALAVKDDTLEPSLQTFMPSDDDEGRSAITNHPLLSKPERYKDIESGLTLVGIVGIKDPARPEVADSILECTRAGIRVMMITGDARDTAVAIAREVNIFPPGDGPIKAFEGREFFLKSELEQLEILQKDNIVFCRAEPADKQKLVKMLQSNLGEITAMTGDGVNDAPALQQASIGLAMGITGTEVSKEAADMILADDNFATIVNAVEEGRRIYANMQAFICFLISCNIGEICAIFFATLAGFPEPLTAMHLLWVNLVTDGPPATALGFNPPAPDLMDNPPRPSDEPIMTNWLLTRYCLTGLYVGLATIGVFAQHYLAQGITLAELSAWSQCGEFWTPAGGVHLCSDLFQGSGRMLPQTLALTTLVCMEMLKALSAVSVDNSIFKVGPQSNPWLIVGVSIPFMLHLFVLYSPRFGLPGLAESFGMVPLSTEDWLTVFYWAAPILLVDEILKAVGRWINIEDRKRPKRPTIVID